MNATAMNSKPKANTKQKKGEDAADDEESEKKKREKRSKLKLKKKILKQKRDASKKALKTQVASSFDVQSIDLKITSPRSSNSCKRTKTSTIGSEFNQSQSSKKASSVLQPSQPSTGLSLNSNFKIPKKRVLDKETTGNIQEKIKEKKVSNGAEQRKAVGNFVKVEPWQHKPPPVKPNIPETDRGTNYVCLVNSLINVQHWLDTSPCVQPTSWHTPRDTVDTHSSNFSVIEQEQETPMIIDSEDAAGISREVHEPSPAHPELECSKTADNQLTNRLNPELELSPDKVEPEKAKTIYVVLDTNVLANDLMIVDDVRKNWTGETGTGRVILVVPWVVLQELDLMKDDKMDKDPALKSLASNAVRFLHDLLSSRHPQIMGQPIVDATKNSTWALETNDDRILECCLQCKLKGSCEVILFTNDRNLCNKSLVNGIQAHSKDTIIKAVDKIAPLSVQQKKLMDITWEGKPDTGNQLCNDALGDLKKVLHEILEIILKTEMYSCFGDMWLSIILIKPPWRLGDILKCFQKHWIAVFGNVVNRKAKDPLDVMCEKFKVIQGAFSQDDLKALLVASLQFLMHFESRSNYKDRLKPSIHSLRSILNELKNALLSLHQKASCKKTVTTREPLLPLPKLSKVFPEGVVPPLMQAPLLPTPVLLPERQSVPQRWEMPYPQDYTPPPQTTTPVPMSNSTVSFDMEPKNLGTDPESVIQNAFQNIWGFLNQTCGMLFDSFKLNNPIEYERPSVIPTASDSVHFIPRLFPVITKLKKLVESVLQLPNTSGPDEDICLELCYLLENFFVILDMSTEWKLDEDITPEMLCNFYKNPMSREMLTNGYYQLEEYCTLVYFIIMSVKDGYPL